MLQMRAHLLRRQIRIVFLQGFQIPAVLLQSLSLTLDRGNSAVDTDAGVLTTSSNFISIKERVVSFGARPSPIFMGWFLRAILSECLS